MNFTTLMLALGGVGLLLLGMQLITDGLKNAAGAKLNTFLERTTQTRFRAAATGFGITAIVQSSGAVIVTTLGFTNAGILTLRQAAWVVFGSNLGTTMKAWLVAFVGLNLNIEAFALPLVGLGMFVHLIFNKRSWSHLGIALAGFGALFLGLGVMRDAFGDVATWLPVEQLSAAGALGVFLAVIIGALLTALMQSSSASMAVIITASVTGVFTPLLGAALVIGANLGTTSTSVLAAIGATTNARRLALIHVTEKIFTGTIAFILLVPMAWLISFIAGGEGRSNISMGLAFFHTLFNVLSLFLMSFVANPLIRFVERQIKQPELTSEKPRYLDDTVLEIPSMGVAAMHSELKRVFKQLLMRGRRLIQAEPEVSSEHEYINTQVLLGTIDHFAARLGQSNLVDVSEQFIHLTLVSQELSSLRLNLRELSNIDAEAFNLALSQEMSELILSFFASGQLKALSYFERQQRIQTYQELRRQQRQYFIEEVKENRLPATEVPKLLQVLALLEESIRQVVRVGDIIYPELANTTHTLEAESA